MGNIWYTSEVDEYGNEVQRWACKSCEITPLMDCLLAEAWNMGWQERQDELVKELRDSLQEGANQ